MPTHTRLEKDLKRDIVRKNTVMRRLRRVNRKADLWQKKAESGKNRRWNKKYLATSLRYRAEMNRLRNIIAPLVADLDERIHEEMDFSKQEVADFKNQLKAELEEMDRIGGRLQERLAVDVLHRQPGGAGVERGGAVSGGRPVDEPEIVDRGDARVVQAGQRRRLGAELLLVALVARLLRQQDLQSGLLAVACVPGPEDDPHPAHPQRLQKLEGPAACR